MSQIKYGKHSRSTGIAFAKSMNLPNTRYKAGNIYEGIIATSCQFYEGIIATSCQFYEGINA